MSQFQVRNSEGQAFVINDLDILVAKFWDMPVYENSYAKPIPRSRFEEGFDGDMTFHCVPNWFDTIGMPISQGKDYNGVRKHIDYLFEDTKSLPLFKEIHTKYVALLNHWEELGYKLIKM